MAALNRAYQPSNFGPGILEFRRMAPRIFGVRVTERLIAKLKKVPGLTQANPKSNLFLLEVDDFLNDLDGAFRCFREIVLRAGLGKYFGFPNKPREDKKNLDDLCPIRL